MSWQCRLIEFKAETNCDTLRIGDMFYFTPPENYRRDFDKDDDGWYWPAHFADEKRLSAYYKQHNAHRPPLLVWLPGRTLFCVDGACWKPNTAGKIEYYGGWAVTGEAPLITVSPSINIGGSYHGFLQNGVVTDDCEGRKFDELGRCIGRG